MLENRKIKSKGGNGAEDFSGLSSEQKAELVEKILEGVEKKVEKKYDKEMGYEKVDSMRSGGLYEQDQQKQAEIKKKYERDSGLIRQARSLNSDARSFRSESRKSSEEQKRDIDEHVKQEAKKARKMIGKDMGIRQKIVALVALEKADAIAFAVAQKLATQVEMGGARAFLPIMITYFLAVGKDLLDIITGSVTSIFTGMLFGAVIGYFWILVVGGWHGGMIQNRIIKKILVRLLATSIFESLPIGSFVPTFVVINMLSHWDFRKSVKKAEDELANVNFTRSEIQKQAKNVKVSLS